MKTAGIWMCVLGALFVSGCGSELQYGQEQRKITIESEPQGGLVYQINPVADKERIFLGTTPLVEQTVLVPVRVSGLGNTSKYAAESQVEMVRIIIEKEGYVTFVSNLATKSDETMRHDVTLERK
jgi:hypothetical protein